MYSTIKPQQFLFLAFLALFCLFFTEPSFASSSGSLPWDSAMDKLKESITGPVAMAIALIGIVVAGGMLIFGGELGEFARRAIMLVLVLALIVVGNKVLSAFYSNTGAVISFNQMPTTSLMVVA